MKKLRQYKVIYFKSKTLYFLEFFSLIWLLYADMFLSSMNCFRNKDVNTGVIYLYHLICICLSKCWNVVSLWSVSHSLCRVCRFWRNIAVDLNIILSVMFMAAPAQLELLKAIIAFFDHLCLHFLKTLCRYFSLQIFNLLTWLVEATPFI